MLPVPSEVDSRSGGHPMGRASRVFVLVAACSGLASSAASACQVFRRFLELLREADSVVIVRVERAMGDPDCYCQKAVALVERSLKGDIRAGQIELPFVYGTWPADGRPGSHAMVSDSSAVPITFEVGMRYLLLLERTPPPPPREETFN